MAILPGLLLALVLAVAGHYLADFIGIDMMGLPKSPISAIMMAIVLGIIVRNTITLPATFDPGIRFGLVRVFAPRHRIAGHTAEPGRGRRNRAVQPADHHRCRRGCTDRCHVYQ